MHFKLLFAITLPLLLGAFGISALLREKLSLFAYFERLALALALGVGMLALIMFSLPFLKIPLSFQNISLSVILIMIGLVPLSLKSFIYFIPKSMPKSKTPWFYLLLFLVIIKIFLVFWSAYLKPIIGPDLMEYYALAAKHTFIFQAPLYLFNEPPLSFLIQSWTLICLGTWNDSLLSLFFPIMYISLLIIFFSCLKRYFPDLHSLFFTFLLASLPFLHRHAGTAYADFPMAFYYSSATIYLFQFLKEFKSSKDKAYPFLLISMVLLGIGVWVKKPGIYYAGINLSVLAFFLFSQRRAISRKEWSKMGSFAVLFTLIILPWLAFDKLTILSGSLSQALPAVQSSLLALKPLLRNMTWVVIFSFARNMFMEGNWQLLWVLFLGSLILNPRKAFISPRPYLLAILTLQLLALFILFRFTDQFPFILDDTMLNRAMLHFSPVVLYFCAEVLSGFQSKRS